MISMKLTEIAKSLNGEFNGSDQIIKGVSIDTRSIKKDELFLKASNKLYATITEGAKDMI